MGALLQCYFTITRTAVGDNGEYQDVVLTLPVPSWWDALRHSYFVNDGDTAREVLVSFADALRGDGLNSKERKFLSDAVRRMRVLDLTDCTAYLS